MDYYKTEVRKYEKKYNKKSKTGRIKEAKTIQYSIPLQKDNPFQEQKKVFILTINQLNELLNYKNDYMSSELNQNSDYQNVKQNLEDLQKKYKVKESVNDELMTEIADIKSSHDMMQKQLDEQKSKVHDLTASIKKKDDTIQSKQSRIDHLNEENKKALKDLNDVQNELLKYSELKGKLEGKSRFIRWISGLNHDLKMLPGSASPGGDDDGK